MTSLSLCMIVKDEEKFLQECLESVEDFVDEIVVVDTGSKDGSVSIAKKFTDNVHEHKWPDDFSEARNISLGYATCDWILVLDADEIISKGDLEKIRDLIEKGDADAYVLNPRYYIDDSSRVGWVSCLGDFYSRGFKGYTVSNMIRLFRNDKRYRYRNQVHEVVDYSIQENGGKIVESGIPIHHYGELREKEVKDFKREKYYALSKKQIDENPDDPRAYYEAGIVCMHWKKFSEAEENFEKVLELKEGYRNVYYNLARANFYLKKFPRAEVLLLKSIRQGRVMLSSYNLLGILYEKFGKNKEALAVLEKALKYGESESLLQSLGGVYLKNGLADKAVEVLMRARKLNPENVGVLNNLGGVYFYLRDFVRASEVLKCAIELGVGNFLTYKNLALVYLQEKENEKAIDVLKVGAERLPEHGKFFEKMIEEISEKFK